MASATKAREHPTTDAERSHARAEFLRIVGERLDHRLERGESYTTTADLSRGYEELHRKGFSGVVTPSQSVMSVIGRARYRGRIFYARNVVTHKAERSGPGRYAPYRIYLRSDATVPKDYVLVPIEADKSEIAEIIAARRGAEDSSLHVVPVEAPSGATEAPETPEIAPETPAEGAPTNNPITSAPSEADNTITAALTAVIRLQADIIDTLLPTQKHPEAGQ